MMRGSRPTGDPTMLKQIALAAALLVFFLAGGAEATRCEDLLKRFGDRLAQPACFESQDLTTRNELPGQLTTPLDNTQVDKDGNPLPAGAWTPRTDRTVIAPDALNRTKFGPDLVPGVQLQARIASDPTGQARFLLRLPDKWNGRL